MSGNRKNGKGKGREKDQGDTSAFQVDLSREKGKTIYIPGSFWGLKDADAEKLLSLLATSAARRLVDMDPLFVSRDGGG